MNRLHDFCGPKQLANETNHLPVCVVLFLVKSFYILNRNLLSSLFLTEELFLRSYCFEIEIKYRNNLISWKEIRS